MFKLVKSNKHLFVVLTIEYYDNYLITFNSTASGAVLIFSGTHLFAKHKFNE